MDCLDFKDLVETDIAFKFLDKGGKGYFTKEEFITGCKLIHDTSCHNSEELFDKLFIMNNHHEITNQTFILISVSTNKVMQMDNIYRAFNHIDQYSQGSIKYVDFKNALLNHNYFTEYEWNRTVLNDEDNDECDDNDVMKFEAFS